MTTGQTTSVDGTARLVARKTLFDRMRLINRLAVLAAAAVVGLLVVSGSSLWSLHSQLIDAESRRVSDVVDSMQAVFDHFHRQELAGKLSTGEAQRQALDLVRLVRYENGKNYVFVSDNKGVVLLSPLKPETEGVNMLGERSADGVLLWDRITEVARSGIPQVVVYGWPRFPGAAPEEKHSHIKPYQPWGWAYGAGIYLTAVNEAFSARLLRTLFIGSVVLLIVIGLSWAIMRSVVRQLGGDPQEAVDAMHAIAHGDFSYVATNRGASDSLLATLADTAGQLRDMQEQVDIRTQALEEANQTQASLLEQLRATQAHLVQTEKLAALGTLVAGMAHELGTPIGNLLLVNDALEAQRVKLEADLESGVLQKSTMRAFLSQLASGNESMQRNLRQTADLIARFKEVSVDHGDSYRERFFLHKLIDEIGLVFAPDCRKAGCDFINAVPAELQLESYPATLVQLFENLIANALEHAFPGRSDARIEISAQALADGELLVVVSDNGVGIPAANLPSVFDPFFTTRMGRGGTGLGLHIAFNLVNGKLGGSIRAESTPGEGARFLIHLPLEAPAHS